MAMNDINFDELDAAVNSALQQGTTEQTNTAVDSVPVVTIEPAVEKTAAAQEPSPEPIESQPRPAVVRPQRRGQFMDLVHPSSDMTSATASTTRVAVPPARRQAPALAPLNDSIMNADSTEAPTDEALSPDITVPTVPVATIEPLTLTAEEAKNISTKSAEDSSDLGKDVGVPVDTSRVEFDAAVAAVENNLVDETALQPEIAIEEPAEPVTEEVPVTPEVETAQRANLFIEGAAIEKRPLGAFGEEPTTAGVPPEEDEPTTEPTETEVDELSEPEIPQTSEIKTEAQPEMPIETPPVADTPVASESGAQLTQSIPQQYQVKHEETDEDPVGALFAAEQYAAPTPAAKPKKHTALIVVFTVLMALAGAGAIYAAFALRIL